MPLLLRHRAAHLFFQLLPPLVAAAGVLLITQFQQKETVKQAVPAAAGRQVVEQGVLRQAPLKELRVAVVLLLALGVAAVLALLEVMWLVQTPATEVQVFHPQSLEPQFFVEAVVVVGVMLVFRRRERQRTAAAAELLLLQLERLERQIQAAGVVAAEAKTVVFGATEATAAQVL